MLCGVCCVLCHHSLLHHRIVGWRSHNTSSVLLLLAASTLGSHSSCSLLVARCSCTTTTTMIICAAALYRLHRQEDGGGLLGGSWCGGVSLDQGGERICMGVSCVCGPDTVASVTPCPWRGCFRAASEARDLRQATCRQTVGLTSTVDNTHYYSLQSTNTASCVYHTCVQGVMVFALPDVWWHVACCCAADLCGASVVATTDG